MAALTLAVAGLAHPHVETILAEAEHRREVELVGIADPDPGIRTDRAARHGVPVYVDHRDLLTDLHPDVLGVAAVNADRAQLVADGIAAGCHVIADKPLCTTLADLEGLEVAVTTGPGTLTLLLEKRGYPETRAAMAVAEQGELGAITTVRAAGPHRLSPGTRPDWMFDHDAYGGLLNDLAVHDLDLARVFLALTGGDVSSGLVRACLGDSGRPPAGFADHGTALVQFAGGQAADVAVDWLSPEGAPYHGDYRMHLTGTEGTADVLWRRRQLLVTTHSQRPREVALPPPSRPAQAVFDAILSGSPVSPDLADTFEATRLALLAQRAAETGESLPFGR